MNILEICVDLDGGGIDRYVYNYCSNIKDIQFDFVIIKKAKKGILEDDLEKKGSIIYKINGLKNGLFRYYFSLKKILKSKKYDAVHIHLGYKSFLAAFCAKRMKIKTILVHAHIANETSNPFYILLKNILSFITKKNATKLVACGIDAAKYVWGSKEYNKGNVLILKNAINIEQYKFSLSKKEEKRKELNIKNNLILGNVGRLTLQKNQLRLIDIFYEVNKMNKDALLLLIGTGDQEEEIRNKINQLGLNNVLLLGVRDDVNLLLNVIDVFVFPSIFEGLPFTLIEAQCNGLPIICSDTVTKEVALTENFKFLSLNDSNKKWAESILDYAKKKHDENAYKFIKLAGYDLQTEVEKLSNLYIGLINENTKRN